MGISQQDLQPGGVVEFDSAAFTAPDALGFVPADLTRFTTELFVQALVNSGTLVDCSSCEGTTLLFTFSLPC